MGCVPGSPTPCCGDNVCNGTEVCQDDLDDQDGLNVCPEDCGVCEPGLCGNGTYDAKLGECFTCNLDCDESYLCTGMGYCGDGYCNLVTECNSCVDTEFDFCVAESVFCEEDCSENPDCVFSVDDI